MSDDTYQKSPDRDVESWLTEVTRVGISGNPAGVRQLANRMIRRPPIGIRDEAGFRQELGKALTAGVSAQTKAGRKLRQAVASSLPVDPDSARPLARLDPYPESAPPTLDPPAAEAVGAVILERRSVDELRASSLAPVSTLLLSGPPGVGKTMVARYIATQLELPLVTVDLASVMSSFLGRTGKNLQASIEYGRTHEAVVLIDEFDALAKRRDDDADVGELKRLVNVLLLELERWPTTSLLIAATNHEQLLDRAIERRFDQIIRLDLPSAIARRRILNEYWPLEEPGDDVISELGAALDGLSGSALRGVAQTAAKRVLLRKEDPLAAIVKEARARGWEGSSSDRDALIRILRDVAGMTHREIAGAVGVTHPTVGASLRRTGEKSG